MFGSSPLVLIVGIASSEGSQYLISINILVQTAHLSMTKFAGEVKRCGHL
jgi:hypothetical protein